MPRKPNLASSRPIPADGGGPSRGNKPFEVTDTHRRNVNAMVACGTTQDLIAQILEIDTKTLRKHFRREIDTAKAKADAAVGTSLHHMATNGNVAAAIFWAKVRMGWTETSRTELTGKDGAPIDLRAIAANASDDDLAAIAFGSGPALIAPPKLPQ